MGKRLIRSLLSPKTIQNPTVSQIGQGPRSLGESRKSPEPNVTELCGLGVVAVWLETKMIIFVSSQDDKPKSFTNRG